MSLQDKKVVVIGGSAGIGKATAKAAAAAGAHVVIAARNEHELAQATEEIAGHVETCTIDVRDVRGMDYCIEQIGAIDHLVYTAVDAHPSPFLETDFEEARKIFDVKLWGPFAVVQSAAPAIGDGGSITLFSGVTAYKPVRGLSVVGAANGAVEALVRALAVELSPIRVNAISPGFVDTDTMTEAQRKELAATLPVGRVGAPIDMAEAALFAMQNRFMTGTVLHLDGGDLIV
ncbi:MAG TPA: SDR family oxidoreductase [Rhodothermales bacterium]|nr:SDR family oxidoreductase [Rhodothermales bacterium]